MAHDHSRVAHCGRGLRCGVGRSVVDQNRWVLAHKCVGYAALVMEPTPLMTRPAGALVRNPTGPEAWVVVWRG